MPTYVPCSSENMVNSVAPEDVVPFLKTTLEPLEPDFDT